LIKKIRILIIDDSTFFREALTLHLSHENNFEIVGGSPDTSDAIRKIKELRPDVITLDIEMPGMNGIDFLREVMPSYGIPVIVVSSANQKVFDALSSGALDFVLKPDTNTRMGYDLFINELKVKIKIASTANRAILKSIIDSNNLTPSQSSSLIALGASTGGTEALYEVIKSLPTNTPGILIVQHMPPDFTRMYAERLNKSCFLEVKEASSGDKVYPGRVLIARGGYQMRLNKSNDGYFVECNIEEKINGHCPSVDVLFESVAEKAGSNAIGVILTGMGSDGALGLLKMRNKGAKTIGQDEETSVVYGMPKVAYDIGAVEKQAPLSQISNEILKILHLY